MEPGGGHVRSSGTPGCHEASCYIGWGGFEGGQTRPRDVPNPRPLPLRKYQQLIRCLLELCLFFFGRGWVVPVTLTLSAVIFLDLITSDSGGPPWPRGDAIGFTLHAAVVSDKHPPSVSSICVSPCWGGENGRI